MPVLGFIRKGSLALAGAVTVAAAAGAPAVASEHHHHGHSPSVKVLLSGLTGAKAVNLTPGGNVVFADQNSSGGGTLKVYITHGHDRGEVKELATFPQVPADVAYAGHGSYWILFGLAEGPEDEASTAAAAAPADPQQHLLRWSPEYGGKVVDVADLGAYARAHPDPFDQENKPGDSNPYGLAALHDGSVLVADAGANAIRWVSWHGYIKTVARLPVQKVSTSHLPPGSGLPPTLTAEAVPTAVTVGPDGAWYVSELKGFPFRPGTSRIWKIRPGTHNALCDPNSRHAACRLYSKGFTSVIDITFGRHGALYAVEFARGGVGAAEGGDPSAPPPPGLLIKLHHGQKSELVRGKITLPGGIVYDRWKGKLYVTDFQLVPGQGRLLSIN